MSPAVQMLMVLALFVLVIECHLIFLDSLRKRRPMQALMALVMMVVVILVTTVVAFGKFL